MNAVISARDYHSKLDSIAAGLCERRSVAEAQRKTPQENIRELAEAGLFRVFQHHKYGGAELSMAEVLPMIYRTARSCPSTAWVMAVLQIHCWLQGLFSEAAQDDVFATDPGTLICGVLQPKAMARKVEGGYQLQAATWPYASGCDFAQWAHLGGLVLNDEGPPDASVFMIPEKDYEIIDDWHVMGLRGTGSKSLRIDEMFVPEHHAFSMQDAISGQLGQGRSTLFKSAIMPMLCLNVTGPALGAAQTALDVFIQHIENRNLPFSMLKQVDSPQTHRLLGEVLLQLDSAELMLAKGAQIVHEYAEADNYMSIDERARIRAYSSAAVRTCVEAIDAMFQASGGTALQESHPLQQAVRDSKAMAAHAALSHDNNLELWGAVKLDKPLNSPMV